MITKVFVRERYVGIRIFGDYSAHFENMIITDMTPDHETLTVAFTEFVKASVWRLASSVTASVVCP